jgi:fermentation-respiration switch protein FrsA (DUF1100 family)
MLRLLGIALIAYGSLVGALFLAQRYLLYFPDRSRPDSSSLRDLGVREATVVTGDGLELLAWHLPPRPGRPVMAYFHGNGGNIGHRAERLRFFARQGFGVLMPEYRGYGGNPGSPTEAGLVADGFAAMDFLDRKGIRGDRIVLWGESLGSGVAVQVAAKRQVAALVLEAPFTSVAAVAQAHYPFVPAAWLVRDRFDSLAMIADAAAPVLVLHGGRDRIVPARYGSALFAAAREPKEFWFAAEAGHEDLAFFGGLDAAIAFIERHWVAAEAAVAGAVD